MSEQRPLSDQTSPAPTEPGRAPPRSVCTESFPALLRELGASVMVTTCQAGKLVILRADNGTINTHCRDFNVPMGLALAGNRLAIGTALEIWEFHNAPAVADKLAPAGKHDACYLPRGAHFTGNIQVSEMAWGTAEVRGQKSEVRGQKTEVRDQQTGSSLASDLCSPTSELWFVNTRFSCLCTRATRYSFVPRWQPPFITAIAPEDRCHLNGLAMEDGQPRAVTALAVSDKRDGWRPHQRDGGVVVDVPTGAIVCRGLSMPHSPRYHDGRLWLLNSGAGGFGLVDPHTGRYEEVATLPGFTRGLDFHGRFAFIGLSQVPESALLSGLASAERPMEQRVCGVWVVDIVTGQTVAFVRFEEGVEEICAVQVVAGRRFPDVLNDDRPRLADSFVLPDEPLNLVPEPYVHVAVAPPVTEEAPAARHAVPSGNGAGRVAATSQALLINNCADGATNLLLARSASEGSLALPAGNGTGQGFVVRESGPHDLAHIRTWLPGQLLGTPAAQFFIAVDAGTGATAGVAALRVFADRGGRFDLFVPAVLRRRGCGTALLDGIRQTASRAGLTRLLSYRSFETSAADDDTKGARTFAQARGLPVAQEIVHCRAELTAALAVLEPLHRRFEARGPGGAGRARYVLADEVDPRELAIFMVRHVGGFPEDVFERLREPGRGLLLSAMVALVGTDIVGGIKVVMRRGVIFTDSLVVEPSHRGGGIDLGLMYRMFAAAELMGHRTLEFEHDVTNAVMAKLARRFGATQIGCRQCFGLRLDARQPGDLTKG
jgi:uncharacterized protein (TIGR03032 family)